MPLTLRLPEKTEIYPRGAQATTTQTGHLDNYQARCYLHFLTLYPLLTPMVKNRIDAFAYELSKQTDDDPNPFRARNLMIIIAEDLRVGQLHLYYKDLPDRSLFPSYEKLVRDLGIPILDEFEEGGVQIINASHLDDVSELKAIEPYIMKFLAHAHECVIQSDIIVSKVSQTTLPPSDSHNGAISTPSTSAQAMQAVDTSKLAFIWHYICQLLFLLQALVMKRPAGGDTPAQGASSSSDTVHARGFDAFDATNSPEFSKTHYDNHMNFALNLIKPENAASFEFLADYIQEANQFDYPSSGTWTPMRQSPSRQELGLGNYTNRTTPNSDLRQLNLDSRNYHSLSVEEMTVSPRLTPASDNRTILSQLNLMGSKNGSASVTPHRVDSVTHLAEPLPVISRTQSIQPRPSQSQLPATRVSSPRSLQLYFRDAESRAQQLEYTLTPPRRPASSSDESSSEQSLEPASPRAREAPSPALATQAAPSPAVELSPRRALNFKQRLQQCLSCHT